MIRSVRFAIAGAVALLFSHGAAAQNPSIAPAPGTGDPASNMGMLDTDRDGTIDRQEAASSAALASQFTTLDSNRNGALEPAEFSRFEATGGATTPAPGAPGSPRSPGVPGDTVPQPGGKAPPATSAPPSGASPAPDTTTPPPR